MLNREEFKDKFINSIAYGLGDNYEVSVKNLKESHVSFIPKNYESGIVPIVDIDMAYNLYQRNEDIIEELVLNTAERIFRADSNGKIVLDNMTNEELLSNLYPVIDSKRAVYNVKTIVHRPIFDTDVVMYLFIYQPEGDDRYYSGIVTEELLRSRGINITEEEMYERAIDNLLTSKNIYYNIQNCKTKNDIFSDNIIKGLIIAINYPDEYKDFLDAAEDTLRIAENNGLFKVNCYMGVLVSSILFYYPVLDKIYKTISDFYILQLSDEELIIIKKSEIKDFKEIISVLGLLAEGDSSLSPNVYYCTAKDGTRCISKVFEKEEQE